MSIFTKAWATVRRAFQGIVGTVGLIAMTLINLDGRQMRSIFSLAMLGGIIALSLQNAGLIYLARRALDDGDTYRPLFEMLQGQLQFNSGLIAWFAGIMGLVVFGADYFRAKLGSKSLEMGRGNPPPPPSGDTMLDGGSASPASVPVDAEPPAMDPAEGGKQ